MVENTTFLILGLGNGAILAAFGLSLAVFYRSSGVVNFATGAIGMYAAYTYNGLRSAGSLFNPVFGLPALVNLSGPMPVWLALLITAVISAVLGLLCYLIVFRPLRHARARARASLPSGCCWCSRASWPCGSAPTRLASRRSSPATRSPSEGC